MNSAKHFKQMRKGLDLPQAIAEADRCLLCHDAPCSKGCPADTRPAEFIRKLRFRNITGAIRTIKENNILGGACGELCPTQRLCEKECSARFSSLNRPEGADRPIRIGSIQRFLIEHSWQIGFKPLRKERVFLNICITCNCVNERPSAIDHARQKPDWGLLGCFDVMKR